MIRIICTLCVFACALTTFSQTQNIRGKILDKDTKQALPGATIQLLNIEPIKGTVSEEDGNFVLSNVPIGRHDLLIQFTGFEPIQLENLLLNVSKELILNIEMEESITMMEAVEVKASGTNHTPLNEMSTLSARSMSMEELNRHPATFSDPARMALGFAGVSSSGDDILNEIVVRGNSPNGILWRLEGVEIPNPNHFPQRGGAGGGLTMFSTNVLGTSDFFAGAFPAEYGNATAGVFDIKMRNGNNQQRETALQVGLLGLDISSEGPFNKNYEGSYLFNYRYSTLGILSELGINPNGDAETTFQDFSFKVNLPTKRFGQFSLFGVGGNSREEERFTSFTGELANEKGTANMGTVGVSHLLFLSPKTYLKSVALGSISNFTFEEGVGTFGSEEFLSYYQEETQDRAYRFSTLLNHKFNSQHVLRVGGIISRLNYDLKLRELNADVTEENGEFTREWLDTWTTILDSKGGTNMFQGYAQWKFNISPTLTLNSGLHFIHFGLSDKNSIEPRLGLKWSFAPGRSLALGAGVHSQIEPISTYFVERDLEDGTTIRPNENLPLQKSTHLILGYQHQLAPKLHAKIEVYYQRLEQLPISARPGSRFAALNGDQDDIFFGVYALTGDGKGRNYGIDLSVEKHFSNNYYFLVNGSIFKSEYQTLTNEWYQTLFSSNFNLVALGGKEFPVGKNKQNTIGLNGKFILKGGQRYTPIDEAASIAQQRTIRQTTPFTERLPSYSRLDLGVYFRTNGKKASHTLSLNVQNVMNRENVFRRNEFYDPRIGGIFSRDSFQTEIIPVLSYRIEF